MTAGPDYDLTIEAGRAERQYWRDLWHYRELFAFLTWRDILVRYKQTAIGIVWAVLRPLLLMAVLTVVFQLGAKLSSGAVPYPIFVFAGLLPWQLFATALGESSQSLIANSSLVSKIYFPRLLIPAGAVATSLVDFVISLGILALLMVCYGFAPDLRLLALPLFTLLALALSFGAGLWFSALNVRFRDFRYVVPFLIQFGFYLSPVGFAADIFPEKYRPLYALNPMVGIIDGFRWAILRGDASLHVPSLLVSIVIATGLCLSGIWYFRRTERTFADVI